MIKPITFLSTIWIFILPITLSGFNFLLSFHEDQTLPYGLCERPYSHYPDPFQLEHQACKALNATNIYRSMHFGALHATCPHHPTRKVIKESRIAKHEYSTLVDIPLDYRVRTVVIDPGHGGHDPGCLGGNSREKHLALGISLQLAEALRHKYPEVKVILTRDKDVFIPLHERAAIANRNHADLFISIHCNYMPGSRATKGTETYVMGLHTAEHNLDVAKRENSAILLEDNYEKNYDYDPNSPEGHILLSMFQNAHLEQSILFAEKVEHYFEYAQRKSRGVKQAGFVVLKETAMPSVLVETGFLSSLEEEAFLMEEQGQQLIAQAILSAFGEYKAIVEGRPVPDFKGFPAMANFQTAPKTEVPSQPEAYSTPSRNVTNISPRSVPTPTAPAEETPPSPPGYIDAPPIYHVLTPDGRTEESINIQFNVQLAASNRPVDTSHEKWHTTGYLIEVIQEDQLYKYQARNFSTLQSAFEARLLLQARGFPDAFIVAYKNGKRISLEQARKEQGTP
jgi:N-acetylmuramoyl-L-alanine amidase